jgi:transcription initiation factor TFIIIB Brf1 subunit/transcription initiation factor TFIIB
MKNITENHPIGIKCPRCDKKWIRANKKLQNLVCRNCGFVWVDKSLLLNDNQNLGIFVL